jgi:hypothetical protein
MTAMVTDVVPGCKRIRGDLAQILRNRHQIMGATAEVRHSR